ncbi:hypothetical protein KAT80_03320 [Candidatus Pacearchaeota archaeon]|nr:hypothetical protein [Candidatus Pacearchaeota archaeon]
MNKVINLDDIKNREYDKFLRMAEELAIGNPEEERKRFLEDKLNKILKENPDYTLSGGGSLPSDYDFQQVNLTEENK